MAAENLFRLPLALNVANAATEVQIVDTAGSPDGVVVAPLGSLVASRAPAQLWQNTDGATSWTLVGFGSGVPNPMPTGYTLAAGDASEGHLVFKLISDWFDPPVSVPTLLLGRERSQAYSYADDQIVTTVGPWAVAICGPSLIVDVAAGGGGLAHAGSLFFNGGQATAGTSGANVVGGEVFIGGGEAIDRGFAAATLEGGEIVVRGGPGRDQGGALSLYGGNAETGSGGILTVQAGNGDTKGGRLRLRAGNADSLLLPAGRISLEVGAAGGRVLGPVYHDEHGPASMLGTIIPGPALVGPVGVKAALTPSYPSAPGVWCGAVTKATDQASPRSRTWIVGDNFDGTIVLGSFYISSDIAFGAGASIKIYAGPTSDPPTPLPLLITLPLGAGDEVARSTANDPGLLFLAGYTMKVEVNVPLAPAAVLSMNYTLLTLSGVGP